MNEIIEMFSMIPLLTLLGYTGVVLCSFYESWGALLQGRKIWKLRSGDSISLLWITYFAAMSVSSMLYGTGKDDAVLHFCALTYLLGRIPILTGAMRFKKIFWYHFFAASILAGILSIMALVPVFVKAIMFTIFCLGGIGALFIQYQEMKTGEGTGAVEVKALIRSMIANIFWILFGLTSQPRDLFIVGVGVVYFFSYLACYKLYKHKEKLDLSCSLVRDA